MMGIKLTIFTPTYNRGNLLGAAFASLNRQTNKEFEWLIVDDGSIDDTKDIVKGFKEHNKSFPIRYYYKENGGKHRAINYAVSKANGKYFLILDSDDELLDNAVERILEWCTDIEKDFLYDKFAGVAGLRITRDGTVIGGLGNGRKIIDATNLQRIKLKLGGDKAEVYKLDLLKKYPFPAFKGEKFITEEVVWNKIAQDGYMLRWHIEPIYICDYLEGGLTKSLLNNEIKNFKGYTYAARQSVHIKPLVERILDIGKYNKVAEVKGVNKLKATELLNINPFAYCTSVFISDVYNTLKNILK
jgi:glycosyltransferase involved in cell wall biosynthesis